MPSQRSPRHAARRIRRFSLLLFGSCSALTLSLLLSACSGEVQLYDPNQAPQDSIPTDVQKADVNLTFQIATEDSTVSQALGWPEGAVPGAEVTLNRSGSIEELTGVTDADGSITFEKLLEGNYRASALRILSEDERGLLAEPDQDVNALGGGGAFDVAAPETEKTISLAAGRPRSLVISEWSFQWDPLGGGSDYGFGGYLELYNNTDTTIYLDQKLIGKGMFSSFFDVLRDNCEANREYYGDPDHVWVYYIYQFPGSGRQYPLRPGRTAVVATDAIDHSEIVETAVDLSGAEFEFIGSGDVDNPAAANLVSVGPKPCCPGLDGVVRGLWYDATSLAVVAEPADLDAVPKRNYMDVGSETWGLPTEKIVEVVTWRSKSYTSYGPCPMVHDDFDRQEAIILGDPDTRSGHRPILFTTPDGRAVLQHTRTSARDFVAHQRTPGRIE